MPLKPIDRNQVHKLAAMFCTDTEIADFFDGEVTARGQRRGDRRFAAGTSRRTGISGQDTSRDSPMHYGVLMGARPNDPFSEWLSTCRLSPLFVLKAKTEGDVILGGKRLPS